MVKETTPIAMTRTRERASEALPSREPKAKKAKKEKKSKKEKEKKEKSKKARRKTPTPSASASDDDDDDDDDEKEAMDTVMSTRERSASAGTTSEEEESSADESSDASEDEATVGEDDASEEFRRAREALRAAVDRYATTECLSASSRAKLEKDGKEEVMEKACKELSMRVGAVIKKALRKNLSLMGARDTLLETSLSLDDDLRARKSSNVMVDHMDPANFQCRMWDSIAKHDNVVFGRAQAAMDALEKQESTAGATGGDDDDDATEFAKMYREAFIEAYGEDIEALRKDEKTNVSVILRAIQTGVDIVPELQKQLHLQWATLKAKSASNS